MPSKVLSVIAPLLLVSPLVFAATGPVYKIKDKFQGATFFDNFDFFTDTDPTSGFVLYVNQTTALQNGLIATGTNTSYMGVDYTTHLDPNGTTGRQSVRLQSKNTYTQGLFIGDFNHVPGGQCGVWPAWWTLGPNWPYTGEIDIMEGINSAATNLMSLHTGDQCTTSGVNETGTLLTSDCYQYSSAQNGTGCSVQSNQTTSYGLGFNNQGGGVYAMEWTSTAIRIWIFPRSSIPAGITHGKPTPATWGTPVANFQGSCNIPSHFSNHQIVFDTTFCGVWGGPAFLNDTKCKSKATSCQSYVANNPGAFKSAYWNINYVAVYTRSATVTTTTTTTSITTSVKPLAATGTLTVTGVAAGATGTTAKGVTAATGTTTVSVNQTPAATMTAARRRRRS